jgi:hypothetical protein
MREPELVFKAQQAAAALERAWERWRAVHGMTADPMPAISSYVGFSLEEPWGQPRVVFGISADDAEQLVALLDRHDCVGPVHQTAAGAQAGREHPSEANGQADRAVLVPRQAPFLAVDSDGPVFRELMAAARQTSGGRMPAHAGAAPTAGDAGSAVSVLEAAPDRGEAVVADSGADDGQPSRGADAAVAGVDSQDAVQVSEETPSTSPVGGAADAEPVAQNDVEPAAQDGADSAQPDDAPDEPAEELADAPGPLAQAASTARVEAEARIRAAMSQVKAGVPSPSGESAVAEPQDADPGDEANEPAASQTATDETATDETATDETRPATPGSVAPPAAAPAGKRGSAKKPTVEAGIEAPTVAKPGSAADRDEAKAEAADRDHPHDIASSLGGPESEAEDFSGPTIGAFGFGSDLVGSVGSYSEPGSRSDQSQDHGSSGYARRNRSSRSYSIPRLSKSRRAGVSPGA